MNLLEARIEEFIRSGEGEFNALALEVFNYQLSSNPAYSNFVSTVQDDYQNIANWEGIPTLPITAFKEAAITTFAVSEARNVFRSSGTTAAERSSHYFKDLNLYELSIVHGWPSRPSKPVRILAFSPSPAEAPDSSLAHMFQTLMGEFGDSESTFTQDPTFLAAMLRHAETHGTNLWLLGTVSSFNRFLDHCHDGKLTFQFANRLLLMETGGFKGHRESLPPALFYRRLAALLGIPSSAVLSEYSMSELSSQFYSDPKAKVRAFHAPPWVRWRVIHPLTGAILPPGRLGVLEIFDLANAHAAFAIRTDDVAQADPEGGFVLGGRAPRAPQKGCSLSV